MSGGRIQKANAGGEAENEIFYANVTEFTFLYQEFIWHMLAIAVLSAAVLSIGAMFLPKLPYKLVVSINFFINGRRRLL